MTTCLGHGAARLIGMNAGLYRPYRFAAALSVKECADLLAVATTRPFREGQEIIAQGDTTDHVVVLRRGHVKIMASTEDKREVL